MGALQKREIEGKVDMVEIRKNKPYINDNSNGFDIELVDSTRLYL